MIAGDAREDPVADPAPAEPGDAEPPVDAVAEDGAIAEDAAPPDDALPPDDAVPPDDPAPLDDAGEELAEVERERGEYLALAQRTQADFENYRKRTARELAAAGARAKAALARELLPVVDNLERALDSADIGDGGLAEGVLLVHSELIGALERSGVESFEPAGEPFDPTFHEALSTRPEDGATSGLVLEVVEKGYRLDGAVLRPARVVVSA